MSTVQRMSVLLAVLALIPLARGQSATNEQAATNESPLSLAVDLADGSRLMGVPGIASIPVQTAYAKLDIPLKQVRNITLEKDRELAVFEMTNGDRVKGAMILKTLVLQTAVGKVSVGAEQIVKITVDYGGSGLDGRTKFDAAKDFSLKDNPAGPWSYGWTQTTGAEFHLLMKTGQIRPELGYWASHEDQKPFLGINTSDDIVVEPTATIRPKQTYLHPGAKGECAVIRWTALRTGTVKITGKFFGLSGRNGDGPRTTTDVHILHGEKEVFASGVNLPDRGNDSPFDIKVDVRTGDTIDFVVGYGNGQHYDDITGLDVIIDY